MDKELIEANLLNIVAFSTLLMDVEKIISIAVLTTALIYNVIKLYNYFKTKKLK
jgi:hypothetical protein